jgi:hypothetical protein
MRIGLCGIVKNEAPYLIDWIAWYSALGFTDFIIADNESDDGTWEVLRDLTRKRMIHSFRMQTRLHTQPQSEAYFLGANLAKHLGLDWIAFFDPDEYLLPATPQTKVPDFLASLPDDCGALCIDWALYGSSGQIRADERPTPYRFEWRGEKPSAGHYKTIARVNAFKNLKNCHHITLAPGYDHSRPDGSALEYSTYGKSAKVVWDNFRLNHYSIRSWAEFSKKKLPKGRADKPEAQWSARYYLDLDKNEVQDPLPDWCRPAFEEKRIALVDALDTKAIYEKAVAEVVNFEPPPLPRIDQFESGHASIPRKNPEPRASFVRRRLHFHAKRLSHKLVPRRPPRAW